MRIFTQKNISSYISTFFKSWRLLIALFLFTVFNTQAQYVEIKGQRFNKGPDNEIILENQTGGPTSSDWVGDNTGDTWRFKGTVNHGLVRYFEWGDREFVSETQAFNAFVQTIEFEEVDISAYQGVGFSLNYSINAYPFPGIDSYWLIMEYTEDGSVWTSKEVQLVNPQINPDETNPDFNCLLVDFDSSENNGTGEENPYVSNSFTANTPFLIPDTAIGFKARVEIRSTENPEWQGGISFPRSFYVDDVVLESWGSADLVTTLSVDNTTPNEGEDITYTIDLLNNELEASQKNVDSIYITYLLPEGVTYKSYNIVGDGDGGEGGQGTPENNYDSDTGVWFRYKINPTKTQQLNIIGTVNTCLNGATITSTITDIHTLTSDPTDEVDILSVDIAAQPEPCTIEIASQRFLEDDGTIVSDEEGHRESGLVGANDSGDTWRYNAVVNAGEISTTSSVFDSESYSVKLESLEKGHLFLDFEEVDISGFNDVYFSVSYASNGLPKELDFLDLSYEYFDNGSWVKTDVRLIANDEQKVVSFGSSANNGTGEANPYVSNRNPIEIPNSATNFRASIQFEVESTEEDMAFFIDDVVLYGSTNSDLVTTITVDNPTPNEGDEISYSTIIRNNGPGDISDIFITNMLPEGVTYVKHRIVGVPDEFNNPAYNPNTGIWNHKNLKVGQSRSLIVTTIVGTCLEGATITNTITDISTNTYDPTNIGDILSVDITVQQTEVTFTAIDDRCLNNLFIPPPIGFEGSPAGGLIGTPAGGVYTGVGVTNSSNVNGYVFNQIAAGVGIHTITYTYTDENGCEISVSDDIQIFDSPEATFTAPPDICIDSGIQTELGSGLPIGGVYSGDGVTDDGNGTSYSFDPTTAGPGIHEIRYTVGVDECVDSTTDDIEVFDIPAAPVSDGDIKECAQNPIQTITAAATVPTGISIIWYDAATDGNVVASPTLNTLGIVTYYAESVHDTSGCINPTRTLVTLEINSTPAIPIAAVTQPTCAIEYGTIVINTQVDVAYSIDGVNFVASNTFTEVPPGDYTLAVQNINNVSCISTNTETVTINPIPSPPAVPTVASELQPTCAVPTGTIVFTRQTGVEYGVNGVYQPGATFSGLAPDATYTLTVRNISDHSCITAADSPVTLNPVPTPPTTPEVASTTQPTCDTPTGTIVFTAQTGVEYSVGNGFQGSETFTGLTPDITYTLTVRNTADNTCTTDAADTVTINAIPNNPTEPTSGGDQEFCEEGTIPTLTVTVGTGETADWYATDMGGTPLSGGQGTISFTPPFAATYYAETRNTSTGCVSSVRTAVVLTENLLPTITVTSAPACSVDLTTYSLEIDVSTGTVTSTAGTVTNTTGNTWTITAVAAGTDITVTVTDSKSCVGTKAITAPDCSCPVIAAPTSGGDIIECEQNPIQTLTATATPPAEATDVVWYDAATGGNVVENPTLNTVGQITYYAESLDSVTGCISTTRTPVLLGIEPAPGVPISDGDVTECVEDPIQTLTAKATAPAGSAVRWYDAATDGNIVASPTLNSIGTITYYAESINVVKINGSCSGLSRTAVTLTINDLPSPPGVTTPVVYCLGETATALTATGTNLLWYTAATGGTGDPTAPIPSTANVGDSSYFVSQTDDSSCESLRSEIVVTINPYPPTPVAAITSQPTCAVPTGTIEVESPLGATLEYSLDGIDFTSNPIFTELASGSYTIIARDTSNPSCESIGNTLTVMAVPATPATPEASATVQPTCGVQTGTIEISAPLEDYFEYSVNGTDYQSSPIFTALIPGDYTLTVRNANDNTCLSEGTLVTINPVPTVPDAPTASTTVQPTCATFTGTIEVTAPLEQLDYSIDDGENYQTSTSFTGLEPGEYTIITRKLVDQSCVSPSSAIITVNPIPNPPVVPTLVVTQPTCALSTGTIEVTNPTGENYEFSIDGSTFNASPIFSELDPKSYTVTVRSTIDTTCTNSNTVTINNVPTPPAAPTLASTKQPTCDVGSGSIIFNSQNDVEYSVGGAFQDSETFYGLSPGNYTLSVRSVLDNTCTTSGETVTIDPVPNPPIVPETTVTQPTCAVASGTIEVTNPIGGNFEYSIDNGDSFQMSPIFTDLIPNDYSIAVRTVADPTCINIGNTITINPVPTPPAIPTVASVVQATCAVSTGTIVFTYQPGVEYSVGGNFQPNEEFNGLDTDVTYTLTVRSISDNTCTTDAASTVTLNPVPTPPTVPTVASTTQPTCDVPTGTIIFTTQADVEYSVGNGFQASETFTGLSPDTTYTLTVRSTTDNTCKTDAAATVTINAIPNNPTEPTSGGDQEFCEEGTIPSLTVTVGAGETADWYATATGGTPLTDGEDTTTYTPLFAATYYAETRNTSTGCVSLVRTPVKLTENLLPTITVSSSPVCSVDLATYSLAVEVSTGTVTSTEGTVTNTSGNTWTITDVSAGNDITVSVTDSKSCIKTKAITAPDCSCPVIEAPVSDGNSIECEQNPIQTLTATATLPTGATEIVWYDADSGGNIVESPTLSSVGFVIYYAEGLDNVTGCKSTTRTPVLLGIEPAPDAPVSGGDITECAEDPIQILTAEATAPAGSSVIWYDAASEGNIVEIPTLNTIGTITYYAESTNVVKINGNCDGLTRTAVTLTLNAIPSTPGVTTPVIYCKDETAIALTATGTNLLWYTEATGGKGDPIAPIPSTAIIGDTSYFVSQTDGNSCESLRSEIVVTINAYPSAPIANIATQPSCAIGSGTIEVESPLGATLEYSTDGINYQSSPIFTELVPGEYTITVRDTNDTSCEVTGNTLTIKAVPGAPAMPIASATVQPNCELPTGTIEVTPPSELFLIYSIDGVNFQPNRKFEGLTPGTYTVTAKRLFDLSCESISEPVTINAVPEAPETPIASVTTQPTCDLPTGTIEVSAPIGSNFEYSIDEGVNYQTATTFTAIPGTYTVQVRDINILTCISYGSPFTVNPVPSLPPIPEASATVQPTCDSPTGTIVVTAPLGDYLYSLGGSFQTGTTFDGLSSGTYIVYVKRKDDLINISRLNSIACATPGNPITIDAVPVSPDPPVAIVTFQPDCEIATGTIAVESPLGATLEYSLDGINYQLDPIFTELVPNTYAIIVRDTSDTSCASIGNTLTINNEPERPIIDDVIAVNPTTESCPLLNDGSITINASGTDLEYSIDDGINFQVSNSFTDLVAGVYTIVVKNSTTACLTVYNTEIELVAPACFAELQVDKTQIGGPDPVTTINQVLEYEIVLNNTGTIDLTGINAKDILPDGTTIVLQNPESSINEDDILNVGETWTYLIEYTVTVEDINKGLDLINAASVISDQLSNPIEDTAITELIDLLKEFILPNEPGSTKKGFGFSPNGDGKNDVFRIHSDDGQHFIEKVYPNFKMEIFNRWGQRLFIYTHNGDPNSTQPGWDGKSNEKTKSTINAGGGVPAGTYFYTVYFNDGIRKPYTGWIYLSN